MGRGLRLVAAVTLAGVASPGCGGSAASTRSIGGLPAPPSAAEELVYCAYLADVREGERCLAPMPASLAAHRGGVWVVRTVGGRVMRIEYQNAYGELVSNASGVARQEFRYEGDHLAVEIRSSASGRVVARWLHSPDGARMEVRDARGDFAVDPTTGAEVIVRRFDARGFTTVETHLDRDGKPASAEGATELRFARDDHGFIEGTAGLDAHGRPSTADQSCAEEKFERNALGGRTVTRCFDDKGQPALDAHGVHLTRRIFDDAGNLVEERFYGVIAPTTFDGKGIHRFTHRVDDRGLTVETLNLGLDDKPAANSNGIAATRLEHDAHGRLAKVSHFDAALGPLKSEAFGARLEFTRDDQGRIVERRYVDVDGSTIGVHRLTWDERDLETEVKCLDAERRPRACNGRAYGWRNVYDARRRVVETTWLDASGAVVENKEGIATIRFAYGPNGKKKETPLDASGAPALVELGAKHILVNYAGARRAPSSATRTREQARRRAEEVLAKLKKGLSFEEAATTYSDDPDALTQKGDLGHFKRGVMVPPFEEALLKLAPGEMSGVVETVFGFHVIVRTK